VVSISPFKRWYNIFIWACELFAEDIKLLKRLYEVRLRASEAHFWLFLAAIEETTTEIEREHFANWLR
jgi:hypothetical protein